MPHRDFNDDLSIPPELQQQLQALYDPGLSAPAAMDQAILAEARARAAAIRRRRMLIRAGAWGSLAAAAGLALAVIILSPSPRPSAAPAPGPIAAVPRPTIAPAKDINGDGVVDILDALALAHIVEGRTTRQPAPAWDFTGDGIVDRRDAEAIAAAAVHLEERG
jgi:hypothetical protein